jgi:peroxiredoxin (alkyl hydroperoxide reductase subunit C)
MLDGEFFEPYHEMPLLGEPAPDFTAETTHGSTTLSDYAKEKKWVVLFSHPADFTPVCTTEFMAFANQYAEFEKRNVALIGLSVDSISSHLAWVRNIKEKLGVAIPFPVIADLNKDVASLYGMIQPSMSTTAACRAVFFIDPKGILKAMIYYPLTTGRFIPEIIRVIDSLQATEKYGVSTPANWKPGEKVIVGPPKTQKEMDERDKVTGPDKKEWYLLFKDL